MRKKRGFDASSFYVKRAFLGGDIKSGRECAITS